MGMPVHVYTCPCTCGDRVAYVGIFATVQPRANAVVSLYEGRLATISSGGAPPGKEPWRRHEYKSRQPEQGEHTISTQALLLTGASIWVTGVATAIAEAWSLQQQVQQEEAQTAQRQPGKEAKTERRGSSNRAQLLSAEEAELLDATYGDAACAAISVHAHMGMGMSVCVCACTEIAAQAASP